MNITNPIQQGIVIQVNHEKHYVSIDYKPTDGGKVKNINGQVDTKTQQTLKEEGIIKKLHNFQVGDTVTFITKLSHRGDKMIAGNIQYCYNEALDVILNKAKTKNTFTGYLKIVDNKTYIKEIETYLFFAVAISPWQKPFTERQLTEATTFTLQNMDKKEKAYAVLDQNDYITAYQKTVQLYNKKEPIETPICAINEFGIYVQLYDEKLQAKLPLTALASATEIPKVGDTIKIIITYLSNVKIVIELAN